jgi:hypothetical protein
MRPEERDRLKRVLASFDEAGLVALANVGLVRRARKDLDAGGVSHEETDAAVIVRGPDWSVTMPPDGPTRATDTTKATGITRHFLAATIYLREKWANEGQPGGANPRLAEPDGSALAEALLALTVDDLQKWAGKTALKDAIAVLNPPPAVEVEMHAGLAIRLVQHGVEARLFPGTGSRPSQLLDAIRTTAPKAHHARWVLVAVLAFQASRGKVPTRPTATATAEPTGTPLTRRQVLESARELFAAMVGAGLAHLSDRTAQRLFTSSVSATAVVFPRLARLVRAIADDVELALNRNAAADPARLFERLCAADALARALLAAGDDPPPHLAGRPRTEYDPVGDLTLAGVGAFPWQTASGFEGVTTLFWDLAGRRFLTWTATRPVSTPGRFNSDSAYRTETLWRCGPAERLCRSLLALRGARLNPAGRLSASKESAAEALDLTEPARIDFGDRAFSDWALLASRAAGAYPLGLAEPHPLDRVVVLRPAAWGERVFDELRQCLCWTLRDAADQEVTLTLPWVGVNEDAIEFLEAVRPAIDRLTHVVARVAFAGRGLSLEPLALLGEGNPNGHRVFSPGFDRGLIASRNAELLEKLRAKYGRDRIPTTMTDDEDDFAGTAPVPEETAGLGGRLREYGSLLLRTAEAGARRAAGEATRDLCRALRDGGLTELTDPAGGGAAELLRAGYLVGLHRQALLAAALGASLTGGTHRPAEPGPAPS